MQPRELVIEGLTSFHDRVVLDFTDASLFALVGPTGAGKSSVVDAVTLALYGRIPRLHANEVAPAISTDANECTVGLTFTVRGRLHRAVRTIRRTKTGASTVEAALEQLDEQGMVLSVLAGTADDLTAEVERLIGLTFAEFTKAVVLPQGEFARVLRAQPKERQGLLSRLLGVGVYDRVKQRAGAHARSAQERAEQTSHQIHQLGPASAEELSALEARIATLDDLIEALKADNERLQAVRDAFRDATEAVRTARARVDRVQAVDVPPQAITDLADRLSVVDAGIEKAGAALQEVEVRIATAETGLPDGAQQERLRTALALHERTPERLAALAEAADAVEQARTQVGTLEAALVQARARVAQAEGAQAAAHREHAATQSVVGLGPGDDCPVCASTLTSSAPALAEDRAEGETAMTDAARELAEATRTAGGLEGQLARARSDVDRAEQARRRAEEALVAHQERLEGQPSAAQARADLARAAGLEEQLRGLRQEGRSARADLDRARSERRKLEEQAAALAASLDRMRLSVAELGPPAATGEVVTDWQALHDWARQQEPALVAAVEAAEQGKAEVTAEGSTVRQRMEQACDAAGVPRSDVDPRDRAVQHRADLTAERSRLLTVQEMAERLRADEADAREQAQVGGELARLLRTDQFQRWLLDEATRSLVAGASNTLRSLSSGRYELTLDGRNGSIQVRDLASAGAPRSVRTLSGGETFLASLALALSLAEQIAVSASGPVALESLFIDEGFGALDPETLDIAAGAIELLGATDRTVGVITHVAELAERLPTRFVVERTSGGSRVKRVDL